MQRFQLLAAAAVAVVLPASAQAGVVFGASPYNQSLMLSGGGTSTQTGVTFANGNYYTVQGGGPSSPIAQYNAAGTLTAGPSAPTPGFDFRSISTTDAGATYAFGYSTPNTVYRQTGAFNNFVAAVTLSGTMSNQGQVVVSADGANFYGNNNGVLQVWNSSGALLRSVTLGAGTSINGLAIYGNYALNENNGVLRAFDLTTGALVDQTNLLGSISGYAAFYGQGYANGYFFVAGVNAGTEVGYAIGAPAATGAVPEPATWAMMLFGFGGLGYTMRRRGKVGTRIRFA